MNKFKRIAALVLVVCMVLSFVPVSARAADSSNEDFIRVYHVDAGRKYFSVDELKEIIDTISENHYTHLELAIGNEGLRFLLDDMSVGSYSSEDVTAGIQEGNRNYNTGKKYSTSVNELTEEEMDEIIDYAAEKHIEIIPLLNTPGHMNAILDAMEYLGISNPAHGYKKSSWSSTYTYSATTVDLTNGEAMEFVMEFVSKYVDYFASRGCTYFNLGADEYATDLYNEGGFGKLQDAGLYDEFVVYLNDMAAMVKDAGLKPIAFNDGIYFNSKTSYGTFDADIIVAYWCGAWGDFKVTSVDFLIGKGHKILNTNDKWYYVLGRNGSDTYGYVNSKANTVSVKVTTTSDNSKTITAEDFEGAMLCLWCDDPTVSYADNKAKAVELVQNLSVNNPDYFVPYEEPEVPTEPSEPVETEPTEPTEPEDVTVSDGEISVSAPGLTDVTITEVEAPAIEGAVEVIAYDVDLTGAEGAYTGEATVTVPVPGHWVSVLGGVLASDSGEEILGISGKLENGFFTFTVPHFSEIVVYSVTQKTIDLVIGETREEFLAGGDYTGDIPNCGIDETIATVTASRVEQVAETYWELVTDGVNGIEAGKEYVIVNSNGDSVYALTSAGGRSQLTTALNGNSRRITSNVSNDVVFTFEAAGSDWYLKDSNGTYLYTTATYDNGVWGWGAGWEDYGIVSRSSTKQAVQISGTSSVTIGRYLTSGSESTTAYIRYNNGYSGYSSSSNLYLYEKVVKEAKNDTKLTFTGVSAGTTTAIIGGVEYTIKVSRKEVDVTMVVGEEATFTQSADITSAPEYSLSGIVETVVNGKNVTFTAKNVGEVDVTLGDTIYHIIVTTENFDAAENVKIEFWHTNFIVTPDDPTGYTTGTDAKGATFYQLELDARTAYKKDGLVLKDIVPSVGWNTQNKEVRPWKGVVVPYDASLDPLKNETLASMDYGHQTTAAGHDRTASGPAFQYIRYWAGKWEVSADRTTWIEVDMSDNARTVNGKTMQLVCYYLQFTEVTDEVETLVVDWGVVPATGTGGYNSSNFVLLDYAVMYPNGQRTPALNGFPIADRTQAFHCDPGDTNTVFQYNNGSSSTWSNNYRWVKSVLAVETSEYEVYMITLTPTNDSRTTALASNATSIKSNYNYGGTEKVVWVDDMANLGKFSDESLWYEPISGKDEFKFHVGGEPVVEGIEIFNRHGMLVTYYLRAKVTDDSLTVHYVDVTDPDSPFEFYDYNIAVNSGVTFDPNISRNDSNPNSDLINGTVTNTTGKEQTVSADLTTLTEIGAQYTHSDYTCIRVERSEDGKNVYIYYEFRPVIAYVVDFGLPINIKPSDLDPMLNDSNVTDIAFSGSPYTEYGYLTDNGKSVDYEPIKVMHDRDFFTLLVTTTVEVGELTTDRKVPFRVYVYPATTVYYDEMYVNYGAGWSAEGETTGYQETQFAGDNGVDRTNAAKPHYGYNGTKYNGETGMSNGTEVTTSMNNATAEFTFTGTGVDIYANCFTDTSDAIVLVYDSNDKIKKYYQVKTETLSGTSGTTDEQEVESFGLPVVSVEMAEHGTYRVVINHFQRVAGRALRIDGFRVYNTLANTATTAYAASERSPEFVELRDQVLAALNVTVDDTDIYDYQNMARDIIDAVYGGADTGAMGAVLLSNGGVDRADLLNNGPKNELFLWPGETVSFNLGSNVAQLGMKAVDKAATYSVNVGTAAPVTGTISTCVDMFYVPDATGEVIIKNESGGILSITKLKVFGSKSAGEALQPVSVELITRALEVMSGVTKPEPVNPFVDVAEGSWYYDSVLWAVENGITTGADASHFLPDAICQRASVVTFLWRAAGSPEPESTVNPFVDVTEDAFFYKAVLWAVEKGITNGMDATHFAPFNSCSRAQVVTFLWRAKGSPAASAGNPFTDVAEGQWYTNAVLWAVKNGITNGMSSTLFGVESICNRAQIVTFLYRASTM